MRCLLIEDEKKVADFVSRGLRAERFALDVAHDGNTGWDFATKFDYDIIILDLMLPGLSGTDLLERLRKQNLRTPVLILTARDATADKVRHFDAATGVGNGSVFRDADSQGVSWGIRTALGWYADRDTWSRLMRNAMAADFSWPLQVPHYEELYRSML